MITKTSHYTATQLERLRTLAKTVSQSDAILLREALDDLLKNTATSCNSPRADAGRRSFSGGGRSSGSAARAQDWHRP
jgi:hypothetical protein